MRRLSNASKNVYLDETITYFMGKDSLIFSFVLFDLGLNIGCCDSRFGTSNHSRSD